MSCIEIVFETQMLYAAATAPHKLQGLYPNFDMPFDIVRGHHLIRRFGLHTLGDHWLIGHQKLRASQNVVGKSCSKDCCHRANTPPYFFPSFAWKPSIDQLGHATVAQQIEEGGIAQDGEEWLDDYPLVAAFDCVVESAQFGLMKPDPEVFLRTAELLGEQPERCLFVDDLPANLAGARSAGMTTLLFDVRDPACSAERMLAVFGLNGCAAAAEHLLPQLLARDAFRQRLLFVMRRQRADHR